MYGSRTYYVHSHNQSFQKNDYSSLNANTWIGVNVYGRVYMEFVHQQRFRALNHFTAAARKFSFVRSFVRCIALHSSAVWRTDGGAKKSGRHAAPEAKREFPPPIHPSALHLTPPQFRVSCILASICPSSTTLCHNAMRNKWSPAQSQSQL